MIVYAYLYAFVHLMSCCCYWFRHTHRTCLRFFPLSVELSSFIALLTPATMHKRDVVPNSENHVTWACGSEADIKQPGSTEGIGPVEHRTRIRRDPQQAHIGNSSNNQTHRQDGWIWGAAVCLHIYIYTYIYIMYTYDNHLETSVNPPSSLP